MAISLMACLLAEADLDDEIGSMYAGRDAAQNIGHVFWVLDPGRLTDARETTPRIVAMVDRLHAVRPLGEEGVTYAGERQARTARERLRDGIPVARGELERLAAEAGACGDHELEARVARLASSGAAPR
jgi:LDH2 family malate/lactate/ureidoglycolate dehydrogenase